MTRENVRSKYTVYVFSVQLFHVLCIR